MLFNGVLVVKYIIPQDILETCPQYLHFLLQGIQEFSSFKFVFFNICNRTLNIVFNFINVQTKQKVLLIIYYENQDPARQDNLEMVH